MRIIYFGTPDMAAHILQALVDAKVDVAAIVTKPDTPQGRSSKLIAPAVKQLASTIAPNIPILQPEKCSSPDMLEVLKSYNADLYVVVAYGEILSEALLAIPQHGAINVHFSLLPKYRGAAPFQRAIMNGETESGVSIIKLVKKMDAGDMLSMAAYPVAPDMTSGELADALCSLGTKCLFKVLDDFANDSVVATPQDHSQATLANKITPEECHLDWTKPAYVLHNLVRALAPHPGAWCEVLVRGEKKRLKVYKTEVVDQPNSEDLIVQCGTGYLRLLIVQLEGKAKMQVADLLRGIPARQITF
ncbi:MAG: methionyl-tRNA formyltransferase [Chlamydiales bacterium]|nr:methionyl-tRNA formyltransferase [Chlamydiales bacterium]